ncbi:LOW QUALITY PROTEIN: hypothetical protein BT93_L2235 [Corymbia citriodora subsp. variegata]|uniref:Uncharacterized protein n=1 Tax=Corymbia citriodora subsp. variegata TaxID=360336 RepID=A0A8T0CLQ6_CORYI|nr:LOW QUALITY PROTEIN: hypothetical protein BT93_L2235 [Corymbia citriodora subsp. variegata]
MIPKLYILQQMEFIHPIKKERKKNFIYSCKPCIDSFSIFFTCNCSIPFASVLCMEHQLFTIGSNRGEIEITLRWHGHRRSIREGPGVSGATSRSVAAANPARLARSHRRSHQKQQNHHHDCNF